MRVRKLAVGIAGVATAVGITVATPSATVAAPSDETQGSAGVQCEWVWQYLIFNARDSAFSVTDAERGGNLIGWAASEAVINVRIKGSPRYFGWIDPNGHGGYNNWGWVESQHLIYAGDACV